MDELLIVCRFLVGCYFVWSGSSKIGRTGAFWSQVMSYKITGPRTSRLLASVIAPAEFILGLFFAAGLTVLPAGVPLLFMLFVFSTAIVISLSRKTGNDCGCGTKDQKVSPGLLVRNGVLAVLLIAGLFSPTSAYLGAPVVVVCGLLIVVAIGVYNFRLLGK